MASTNVRTLPPGVRTRLDKLMLLLGSDNEGERANAIGLINHLLKGHGFDWHDVVGAIGQPAAAPQQPPPYAKPQPGDQHSMTASELRNLVHLIYRSPLNDRARKFLSGMQTHADIFGEVKFSDKQWHWMMDLAKRAGAV